MTLGSECLFLIGVSSSFYFVGTLIACSARVADNALLLFRHFVKKHNENN